MRKLNNCLYLIATLPIVSILLAPSPILALSSDTYTQTNLVSDTPGLAKTLDTHLVNPWGLSHSSAGPWWISDNNSGNASRYNSTGISAGSAISIPAPGGGAGTPTGNVFNKISISEPNSFVITKGNKSGPSTFMFATEDGTIIGWNKSVDATSGIIAVDRSTTVDAGGDVGAVYKGLAMGMSSGDEYIYATNFRFGVVEMFDEKFNLIKSFTDPQIASNCPLTNQCFSPFGIQNIRGKLYVTFALQNSQKHDDQAGVGNGFVDVFNTDGSLQTRLISNGQLNSPWGLALAPNNFGKFSDHLLVGNFGDGTINAYDINTGNFDSKLMNASNTPITIDGLWGLAFGNGHLAGKENELFFSAGIGAESHGLFGKITKN